MTPNPAFTERNVQKANAYLLCSRQEQKSLVTYHALQSLYVYVWFVNTLTSTAPIGSPIICMWSPAEIWEQWERNLSFSSADVRGAGTRDEPLRTSVWELWFKLICTHVVVINIKYLFCQACTDFESAGSSLHHFIYNGVNKCTSHFIFVRFWFTALFTNMWILKFKSQLTIAFSVAVNHLIGPLRKQNFTLTGSKGHGLWFVIGGFRSVLCVSVFQGSLLVIIIMIDGSEKRNCEGSF